MSTINATSQVGNDEPERAQAPGVPALLDGILHDITRLRRVVNLPEAQAVALPRLAAIGVATLFVFGAVLTGVVRITGAELDFMAPVEGIPPRLLAMPLAYPLGLMGALGICLPSFYFYALQCGFKPSLRRIVVNTLLALAYTGVFTLGLIPVYAAVVLGVERLGLPPEVVRSTSEWGLALPFVAGFWGLHEIYQGFVQFVQDLPENQRGRRESVVGLLAVWSAALYVAIAPVLVYRLLQVLGGAIE